MGSMLAKQPGIATKKSPFCGQLSFGFSSQSTIHMQAFDANILEIFKALGFEVLILSYSRLRSVHYKLVGS
jgi:hypothetical protein